METRLDRIEKNIEALLQAIAEDRAAQREAHGKIDAKILDLRDAQKQTEDLLNRTIKRLDNIGRQLGDLGLVQGEVAEDLFYRNVENLFENRNLRFDRVLR